MPAPKLVSRSASLHEPLSEPRSAPQPAARPVTSSGATKAAVRLRVTITHLTRQLRALAAPDGPGAAKLGVLGQLYRLGPSTPTRLAQSERVKLQTLTRLLAELDAVGLVRREAHPQDARQTLLSLTPAGLRVLTADIDRREASLATAIASTLTRDETAALLACCASIDRLADALAGASAEPALATRPAARRRSNDQETR